MRSGKGADLIWNFIIPISYFWFSKRHFICSKYSKTEEERRIRRRGCFKSDRSAFGVFIYSGRKWFLDRWQCPSIWSSKVRTKKFNPIKRFINEILIWKGSILKMFSNDLFFTHRIIRNSNRIKYVPLSTNEGRTYLSRFNAIVGEVTKQVQYF